VRFRVIKPLPVLLGPVGPQIDEEAGKYLKGGGTQIGLNVPPRNRGDYIEVINVTPLKK